MDISALDGNILLFIQDNIRNSILEPIMKGITFIGSNGGIIWIVLCLTLLIIPKTRRVGAASTIAITLSGIFSNLILKNLVNRVRPYVDVDGLKPVGELPSDSSFPSGHSSVAFAAAVAIFIALPWIMEKKKAHVIGVLFIVLASLIALSRLYLGMHYPTDVLAGVVLGIIYGICGSMIARLIFKKLDERKAKKTEAEPAENEPAENETTDTN